MSLFRGAHGEVSLSWHFRCLKTSFRTDPNQEEQAMAQDSTWQQATQHQVSMAEIAIRGAALLFDIQMQAARDLMEMQARSASVLGIPDCSSLFKAADDRARRLFSGSADELVNTTRRATETVNEVNRQLGRLVERQAVEIAEQMRQGIDQLGRHAEQGLQQARHLVEKEVDELERTAQQAKKQPGQEAPAPGKESKPSGR